MKLTGLLLTFAVCCMDIGYAQSTTQSSITNEELLERAATQLGRLSAFRKTREPQQTVVKVQPQDNESQATSAAAQKTEDILEAQKRIDELRASASELLQDPRYQAIMQDRIKRSFISGIANKLIGGVVGAASGASRGIAGLSSSNTPSEYGSYGHSYQTKFDIGDFAKAIINTLVQAIKAIGGGAIAGGGALVKGGGYLVSAKGQIISSAGSALTSLGKSIASTAIIASPKPVYGPPGYSYQEPTHDLTYDGPPPSAGAYAGPDDAYNAGHSSYAAPSNDDGEDDGAGVLIVKETNPGHPPTSSDHVSGPSLSALEESFGGPNKGISSTITKITGFLNSGQPTLGDEHQAEHIDYYPEHKDQQPPPPHLSPAPGYESGPQVNHNQGHDHHPTSYDVYPPASDIYDSYGTKLQPHSPQLADSHFDNHQPRDHEPLAYQHVQTAIDTHLEAPKPQSPLTFKDLPGFADFGHQSEPLKLPILANQQNSLDHQQDNQVGSFGYFGLPSSGNAIASVQLPIGPETGSAQLPIVPGYSAYQVHNAVGFDRQIQHPGHVAGGPAILGVWGRISRRTSNPAKKASIYSKGPGARRAVGYSLLNAKLTRI